jgi:PAS domain S-box-containing protein
MINAFGSSADGFISCDPAWRITFINQQAAEILGQTISSTTGRILWEVYPKPCDSPFYQTLDRALTLKTAAHLREFNQQLGVWLDVHAYAVEPGLSIYLQNVTARKQIEASLQRSCIELETQAQDYRREIRQISTLVASQLAERQQAEEALRLTNAQLATLFESITDGFCAIDREWCYTYVNQRAEQLLGKQQSELLGSKIWDVFPESVGSQFYHQCHEVVRTGESAQFEDFSPFLDRWFHNNLYPSATGITHFFQDITQRKQLEESRLQLVKFLAEASAILGSSLDCETTLTNLAQLTIPFLADYCLIHRLETNGRLRRVTATHRDPQKQPLVNQLASYYPVLLQNPDGVAARVLQTQEPLFVAEFTDAIAERITQDPRILELYRQLAPRSGMLVPLSARGQSLGAMTLMRSESARPYDSADLSLAMDLGQRAAIAIDNAELYKKAQESSRLKDEFLMTLSHELRTPLNSILGWAKLLQSGTFTPEILATAIATIERKASEQVKLIYDLLTASNLLTGTLELQPTWIDLFLLVQEVVEALQLAAAAKSICVESQINSALQPIWGDRRYLRQALWNLLSNAIKFTPNDGRIEIRLIQLETETEICISDTGQGIAPTLLPHIFERFRQADGSSTRHHGGLGLGLSLVYHIVELHGGSIEAVSEGEGMGATFIVRLPALRSDRAGQ